jgi:hypothetical protein
VAHISAAQYKRDGDLFDLEFGHRLEPVAIEVA